MIAQYFKEQYGAITIESEHGFIMYNIGEAHCHIKHLYIKPESRDLKKAIELFDKIKNIAKENKSTSITCDIDMVTSNYNKNLQLFLNQGFVFAGMRSEYLITLYYPLEK